MKRIYTVEPKTDTIDLYESIRDFSMIDGTIISYETQSKNGIAILTKAIGNNKWGFRYFSHLVLSKTYKNNFKFYNWSLQGCVSSALNAGRTVHIHESFHEFIEYANEFYSEVKK